MSEANGHATVNGQVNGAAANPFPRSMGGQGHAPLLSERSVEAVLNAMMARQQWFNNLLDKRRNLEDECGYPPIDSTPAVDLFRQLYDREPIPNRVVQCMPKESWQVSPLVYEDDSSKTSTRFEQEWDDLGQQLTPGGGMSWHQDEEGSPVWEHLLRGDILSRIGRFGLILLGVDDGKGLETPLDGVVAAPLLNRRAVPILVADPKPGKPNNKRQIGVKLGRMVRNGLPEMPDGFLRQEDEDWLLDDKSRQRQVWNVKERRYDTVDGVPLTNEERETIGRWTLERQLILNKAQGLGDSHGSVSVIPSGPITHMPDGFGCMVPVDNAAYDSPARIDGTSSQDPNQRFGNQPGGGGRGALQERILDERTFDQAKDSSGRSPFTDWSKPDDGSSYLAGTDSQYYGVHFGPSQFPAGREPGDKASESASWGAGGGDGNPPSSPTDGTPDAGGPTGDSGTAPGQPSSQPYAHLGPAAVKSRRRLLFLACYDESLIQVVRWEWNIKNPRFRMPVMYRVTLTDPRDGATGVGLPYATVYVHWSRVVHLADVHANASSSETFAQPVIKPVLNRCLDIRKISGSSAEGYWQAAVPNFSFETHPQLGGDVVIDKAALKDDWENVINSLDRAMVTSGMEIKTLSPTVTDPTGHLNAHIEHICIQIGIPKRVFMGSERGELASSQDDASWNDRVNQRRHGYVTPRIIVPFIDRLIQAGILPEPEGYSVEWPDLDSTSDSDKATIGGTRTTALAAYVAGGCDSLVSPIDFLVEYQGMDEEKAAAVLRNAAKINEAKEQAAAAEQGGPLGPDGQPMPPAFGIPGDPMQVVGPDGQPVDPNAAPPQPMPEQPPPVKPIRLRSGERLVHPETGEDIAKPTAEDSPFGITANELVASAVLAQWDAWFAGKPEDDAWRLVRNDAVPLDVKLRYAERLELARLDGATVNSNPEGHNQYTLGGMKMDDGDGHDVVESVDYDDPQVARQFVPKVDIPVHKLIATQSELNEDQVKAMQDTFKRGKTFPEAPLLVKVGEKYYVKDGHHQLAAKIASGVKKVKAKVFTLNVSGTFHWSEKRLENASVLAARIAQHGMPVGAPFTPDRREAEEWVWNAEGWVIAELELPKSLLENQDMYTLNAAVDPKWITSLLVNEAGTVKVYAPVRKESGIQWDESKHARDKGKFSSGPGAGAAALALPESKWLAPAKEAAASAKAPSPGLPGVDAHGQVGSKEAGHGGDEHGHGHHGHGPEGEVEHAAHQAHLLHEGHEVAEVLGGGHEHAAEALHGHFEEAASGHGPDAHVHGPEDVAAIVASHVYGPALKAVTAVMSKVPGARAVGAAISRLHDGATKLGDKYVAGLQARYGKATAGAILGAGSLSIGSTGALAGIPGTVTKSLPAKNLIGAIPLLAIAEAGKRLGLVGPGTKLEAGLTRAGSWIHAIKGAVSAGASKAVSVAGAAGLKGARLAGRGVGKLIGNEETGWIVVNEANEWVSEPGWVLVGPDAYVLIGNDGKVVLE